MGSRVGENYLGHRKSFEADTSEEDDDEDFRVVASSLCGREEEDARQERGERGREEEEDSIRSELLRSPEIARVAGDRERRLLSPPPIETETWISFPTSRVMERAPGDGCGTDAETLAHRYPNSPVGFSGPV
jgi:hypothetical protein